MLCNSWIVVSRATGSPVLETWSRRVADAIRRDRFEVLTAHDWLVRLNQTIAPK